MEVRHLVQNYGQDLLNQILWRDARGAKARYPAVKHSLFFPMAVDLDDDERPAKKRP